MTITTTDTPLTGQRLSIFARTRALFVAYAEAQSRRDQVAALSALSDADLSARGLTRDGIVRHVFADKLYL